mgnify:CR=1 FL=1
MLDLTTKIESKREVPAKIILKVISSMMVTPMKNVTSVMTRITQRRIRSLRGIGMTLKTNNSPTAYQTMKNQMSTSLAQTKAVKMRWKLNSTNRKGRGHKRF